MQGEGDAPVTGDGSQADHRSAGYGRADQGPAHQEDAGGLAVASARPGSGGERRENPSEGPMSPAMADIHSSLRDLAGRPAEEALPRLQDVQRRLHDYLTGSAPADVSSGPDAPGAGADLPRVSPAAGSAAVPTTVPAAPGSGAQS
jgi:hypothetical protein